MLNACSSREFLQVCFRKEISFFCWDINALLTRFGGDDSCIYFWQSSQHFSFSEILEVSGFWVCLRRYRTQIYFLTTASFLHICRYSIFPEFFSSEIHLVFSNNCLKSSAFLLLVMNFFSHYHDFTEVSDET